MLESANLITPFAFQNIALEGFSEDDNQDGFVDPIGAAVVAAPVTYAAHYPYVHHAVAPVVKVAEAPKVEAKATPVLTYAAPHVYTGYTVAAPHVYTGYTVAHTPAATVPLTYTHTVPAGVITHPYAYGFPYGYAVAAPAKTEEAAETITEA